MPLPATNVVEIQSLRILAGEAALTRLAEAGTSLTPFQQVGFLEPLLRETRALDRFRLIEITAGDGSLLLPVSIEKRGPFILADIAGGKQASYHAGLPSVDLAISTKILRDALTKAGHELGIDAFTFTDCPLSYAGRDNPLTILGRQPSPSSGWALSFDGAADDILARLSDKDDRKKLRQKANKLSAFGPVRAGWAQTPEDRSKAFEAMFRWKAQRFGAAGIDDPFTGHGMRDFLASAGENGTLRLFTVAAGERLVAVLAGVQAHGCFSGMLNGHESEAEIARTSPGEQLIVHLIRALSAEGFRQFDLGVGEARYKAHYCPERIALADCAVGVSLKGQMAARLFLVARATKRVAKQSPRMMALVGRLRRLRSRKQASA
ncbi:MAG: GNAT family N-acetyltransferase [Rhabdaerophilum sp.]